MAKKFVYNPITDKLDLVTDLSSAEQSKFTDEEATKLKQIIEDEYTKGNTDVHAKDLDVAGYTTLNGKLETNGEATFNDTLTASLDAHVGNDLDVGGSTELKGAVSVDGQLTAEVNTTKQDDDGYSIDLQTTTTDPTKAGKIRLKASSGWGSGEIDIVAEAGTPPGASGMSGGVIKLDAVETKTTYGINCKSVLVSDDVIRTEQFNRLGTLIASRTFTLSKISTGAEYAPEYNGQFSVSGTGIVLTVEDVTFVGDTDLEDGGVYQFSICNGYGVIVKVG